jgi:hypothetical protein
MKQSLRILYRSLDVVVEGLREISHTISLSPAYSQHQSAVDSALKALIMARSAIQDIYDSVS